AALPPASANMPRADGSYPEARHKTERGHDDSTPTGESGCSEDTSHTLTVRSTKPALTPVESTVTFIRSPGCAPARASPRIARPGARQWPAAYHNLAGWLFGHFAVRTAKRN